MPIVRRPVRTTATPARAAMPQRASAQKDLVTTATLKRGRIYFYRNISFERNKPVAIDNALLVTHNLQDKLDAATLAEELEDLFETITDSDKEMFEKPIFTVLHNQEAPLTAIEEAAAKRPRRVRTFVEVPDRAPRASRFQAR